MMPGPDDWTALWLTCRLAALTTVILLIVGTPLAWWLSRASGRLKVLVEAMVALPLVLPPTVLGFYLLLAMGPNGPLGAVSGWFGARPPVFTFAGLVMGSVVYSLPFVVQPLQDAFRSIGRAPLEVAATLRAAPWDQFVSVVCPMARPAFLTAAVLGFAHTVGEFGVVLMIGGNIPGTTRVVSIAIYDHVEALEYEQAHGLSALLLILCFSLLVMVYATNRRMRMIRP